jgi:hypothetical protein
MKKISFISFFLVIQITMSFASAQSDMMFSQLRNLSDLKAELAKAKSPEQITNALIALLIYHNSHNEQINKKAAEEYRQKLEIFTNETKDPELIAKSLWWQTCPSFCSWFCDLPKNERNERIDRLYDFAQSKGLKYYQALAKMEEAFFFLHHQQNKIKAVQSLTKALALGAEITGSSKIMLYQYAIQICFYGGNYLQALDYAHKAHELAVKIKSAADIRWAYDYFALIFTGLKEFKKAIAYYSMETEALASEKKLHPAAVRHAFIAAIYILDNQTILADYHIKKAEQLADSLKGSKLLYRQISTSLLHALVQSNHKGYLSDFFKYIYRESLDWPDDEFLFLTASAIIYEWLGIHDSSKVFIKKAGCHMTNSARSDIQQIYFTTAGAIASRENHLDLARKNYLKGFEIDLLSNNLSGCINFANNLKNIAVNQNQPDKALYYSNITDSLRIALDKQLDREERVKQQVAAFDKQKTTGKLEKAEKQNQWNNPLPLAITFGVINLLIAIIFIGICNSMSAAKEKIVEKISLKI